MHTDPLLYRLFQERPALAFALAGLTVPAAAAYRWQAIEVKQTAFRLDGVLWPPPEREDLKTRFYQEVFGEGREEGRHTGMADLLLRQLAAKFGPLTAEHRRRLEQADAETLLRWSERLLTAHRPEEVFGDRH